MDKATQLYEKLAKYLTVEDIENELGFYLPDRREQEARRQIEKAYENSFALRHPWLTGIPTLGIAPSIAKSDAVNKIVRYLVRRHADINQAYRDEQGLRRKERLERAKIEAEKYKARAYQQALLGAANTLSSAYRDTKLQERRQYRDPSIHVDAEYEILS